MYYVATPLMNKWIANKFKDAAIVQKALTDRFPQKKILATERITHYSSGESEGSRRLLAVKISGESYLSQDDVFSAEEIICETLEAKSTNYTEISVINTSEHRFFIFVGSKSRASSFKCDGKGHIAPEIMP